MRPKQRVQPVMVEPRIGRGRKRRLGAIGNSKARFLDHRYVVGPVADCHRLVGSKSKRIAKFRKQVVLPSGIDNAPLGYTAQQAARHAKDIGFESFESDLLGNRLDEGCESSRDQHCHRSPDAHRTNQRLGTGVGPDPFCEALLNDGGIKSFEQRHPLLERAGKIQFALHRAFRDLGDLGLNARIIGQFVDAFLPDHGGIHIGDQQTLLARPRLEGDDIDPFPILESQVDGRRLRRNFKIGGITLIDPSDKLRSRHAIQRRIQQSFVEPSGCYQRRDDQGR